MKKFAIFFLVFTFNLIPQQDKFILGVDWINPTEPDPASNYQLLSNNYWDLLKSFGVNFGALNIGRYNNSNGLSEINTELTQAAIRDINIFLWTYQLYPAYGRRWMYQVENNWDFNSHISGISPPPDLVNAEQHWSQVNVNNQAPNYWRIRAGIDLSGYIAEGLVNDSEIPDSTYYYIKLKIRKTQNISDTTPFVKVWIINKNYPSQIYHTFTLTSASCSFNVWQEKYLGYFYKIANPPYLPLEGGDNLLLIDSLGLAGVEDQISSTQSISPYEIKIEWFGNVSCDIDYVVIDDQKSNNLHNGNFDSILNQIVTEFGNNPGLGKIKIMDEPKKENLLVVRRTKNKLDEYLSGSGNEDKSALYFHVPPYTGEFEIWATAQQFFAQSRADIDMVDIYPINFSLASPFDPNYPELLQARLNSTMTYWYDEEIIKSNLFGKLFWCTPQTHSWLNGLREPSAYEIKLMANLGICYGAKGIHYFMFSIPDYGSYIAGVTLLDDDNINNPVPRYSDAYGFPKWETVKQLNQKIAAIGDELLSLTWQNAYYINNGTQPTGTYITNVQSYYEPYSEGPIIPEEPASTYIQLGIFKKTDDPNNQNLEHFFVVNRRTLPTEQRDIKITINKSSSMFTNWKVTEIGTENTWTVNKTGNFQTTYEPGEGKLFKLDPVMLAGGNIMYSEILPAGETWNLTPGVTFKFAPSTSLIVNGTLNAVGTSSNKITFDRSGITGTWGLITFDGPAASSSILNNVNIKYASDIKCLNGTNVTIQNSLIDHCTGIKSNLVEIETPFY
jgi:hypothetical protein